MFMDMLHCKHKKMMLYGRLHTSKSVLMPLVHELLILKEIKFPCSINEDLKTTGKLQQKISENGERLGL